MRLGHLLLALPLCLAALCPAAEENGEAAIASLQEQLGSNDPKEVYRFWQTIHEAGRQGAASVALVPELTALLALGDGRVIREAAWALGRIVPAAQACAAAIPVLAPESRDCAGFLIGYLKRPDLPGWPDYESRIAVTSLAKLKIDHLWLSGRLANLLVDTHPIQRRRAAEVAGLLGVGTPETLTALANLLDDDEKTWITFPEDGRDKSVWTTHAEIAAWALGRMGNAAKSALPKLRERQEKAAPALRKRIDAAIAAIEEE